jgi:hypothetical protein
MEKNKMTREEYLAELKLKLSSLSQDELNEAMQYYSDYFDEANDDEKVMAELGSPEELSKVIVEKFANVLVKKEDAKSKEENSASNNNTSDALYFEFDKKKVKSLAFNFGASQVVAIPGKKFSFETRGIAPDAFNCSINSEGVLTVNNAKRINLNFWSHDRNRRFVPKVLVTIPQGFVADSLKINIGAGTFESKDIDLKFNKAIINVGAGYLVLNKVFGGSANISCGMGNFQLSGTLSGKTNIDCGMGAVKLNLSGNKSDYSYDAKVGLGDFKFNEDKRSGVGQVSTENKENNFSVNCGMGSVVIDMK